MDSMVNRSVREKLVAYLMAVERGQTRFLVVDREASVAFNLVPW